MGRLGTRSGVSEIAACVRACTQIHLEGLMTHFASAAVYTSDQTDDQIQRLTKSAPASSKPA
jgi:alanine racemase